MRSLEIILQALDLVSMKEVTASEDTIYDTTWEPPVGTTAKCSVAASFLLLKMKESQTSHAVQYTHPNQQAAYSQRPCDIKSIHL